MPVMFTGNKLLFVGGQLAMSEDCCCEGRYPCQTGFCDADLPGTVDLTLAGISTPAGGCASCAATFNKMHTLPIFSYGTACIWRLTGTIVCGAFTRDWIIQVDFQNLSGNATLHASLFIADPLGNAVVHWNKILGTSGGSYNCVGTHAMAHTSLFGGGTCEALGPVPDATLVIT